jgi:type VI secretion system protein ImpL
VQQQIKIISKHFGKKIPLFIIINKSDLITGFREFFGESSRDERYQIWGTLLKTKNNFENEFNKLMRRLNDQLIWRLQHEHNIDKRTLINDLPLQMSQLKPILTNFLKSTLDIFKDKINLAGLFFTSASQNALSANQMGKNTISLNHHLINIQQPSNRSFFIHDLFQKSIPSVTNMSKPVISPKRWLHICFIIFAVLLIISCATTCLYNFKQQLSAINFANTAITKYQILKAQINKTAGTA